MKAAAAAALLASALVLSACDSDPGPDAGGPEMTAASGGSASLSPKASATCKSLYKGGDVSPLNGARMLIDEAAADDGQVSGGQAKRASVISAALVTIAEDADDDLTSLIDGIRIPIQAVADGRASDFTDASSLADKLEAACARFEP
ncbi:hypothetical protein RCH21_001830 [Arthrobacter sp. PL16]|nr:hypothetical protein [Arthrobacter sp. PL16]